MKHGATTHPKIINLAEAIHAHLSGKSLAGAAMPFSISHTLAVGVCERLWQYAAQYLHNGHLGKLLPARIADAIGWPTQEAQFIIDTLVQVGLVDRPGGHETLVIHDWPEHAQDSIHALMARARAHFYDGSAPKTRALKSEERPAADAFYKAHAEAQAKQNPRSRPRKLGSERVDRPGKGPQSVHTSKSGASPRLASPLLASPLPATAPAPKPPAAPRRVVLVRPSPETGGGGGGGVPDLNPEQAKARDALIAEPFPAVSVPKSNALAAEYPPWAIHAAVKRGKSERENGGDIRGGLVVEWITSGDAEQRERPKRRQRARQAWNSWQPSSRANALRDFAKAVREIDDPGGRPPDDLLDFVAEAIERAEAEARRAAAMQSAGGAA